MPEKFFALAESEGILVEYYNLPCDVLGVYYHIADKPPVILLHSKLIFNNTLLRCIFAEELGHHFTTGFDLMAFARASKNYIVRKYEKIAIFWAVEHLMALDELIKAVNSGIFLTREIAEYFDVTERFAGTGIKLYYEKRRSYMEKYLKFQPHELTI